MDIRTGYTGRSIFMTGGTGFVGKVALYKILKEFPDVDTIYVLMRGKKSRKFKKFLNAQERLDLEVLGSPCFDPLRAAIGDGKWNELKKKIKAVNGDITLDGLGIKEEERQVLFEKVNFVIHLAATVNFNERLDLAVQMNTLGGLRVLSLAREMKHLEAMVHVSTCYVNYPRSGRDHPNEERIYPLDCDPEEMVKYILGLNPKELDYLTRDLLKQFGFSNTYTFTKNLGERLILRYRGEIPTVIVRPSIIAASYHEPTPGWVDALTAAGGLILTASLGVVREVIVKKECIADVVPVDFVVNVILKALFKTQQFYKHQRELAPAAVVDGSGNALAATAQSTQLSLTGVPAKGELTPANAMVPAEARQALRSGIEEELISNESQRSPQQQYPVRLINPVTKEELPLIYQASVTAGGYGASWETLTNSLRAYMGTVKKPHPRGLAKCDVTLTESPAYFTLRHYTLRWLPANFFRLVTNLPEPIGSEKKAKAVQKWVRAVDKAALLTKEFRDFIVVEWIYENKNAKQLDCGLDEYSRKNFLFEPRDLNWWYYTQLYTYGIFKHIVRETASFKMPESPPETPTAIFARAAKL